MHEALKVGALMVLLHFLLYSIIFSSGKIMMKLLVLEMPSVFTLAALRLIVLGIFSIGGYGIYRGRSRIWNKNIIPHVLRGCIFRVFIPSVGVCWSLQYVSAAEFTLLFCLGPFMAAFFSYLVLHEKLSLFEWVGMIIGVSSVIPLIWHQPLVTDTIYARGSLSILPELMVFGILFSHHYGWVLMRRIVTRYSDVSYFLVNAYDALIGGFLALCVVFVARQPIPSVHNPYFFIAVLLLFVLVIGIINVNYSSWLLRTCTMPLLSIVQLSAPFLVALIGWLCLGEAVGVRFFIASAFAIVGFIFFYSGRSLHKTV
jgi:drug/metabolite transporter (DMT)-like permease